jgi:acyl carrier protein
MNATLSTENLEIVNHILIEQLNLQPGQITSEARFGQDLGADSLDMVEIGMKLDEQFNLTTTDTELDTNSTVVELYAAVAERLAQVEGR